MWAMCGLPICRSRRRDGCGDLLMFSLHLRLLRRHERNAHKPAAPARAPLLALRACVRFYGAWRFCMRHAGGLAFLTLIFLAFALPIRAQEPDESLPPIDQD